MVCELHACQLTFRIPGQMSQAVIQTEFTSATAKRWAEFRLIPRLETYPAVVSFVQTTLGRVVLLTLFGLGMRYFLPDLASVSGLAIMFGLITFMPEYRRFLLAVAPLIFVVLQSIHEPFLLVETLSVVALGMFLYWCAIRWPKSRFGRRPVVFLLTGFSALIVLACTTAQHSRPYLIVWNLVGVVASYIWFIAYAVTDKNSTLLSDAGLQLASFRPLWGSTNTPFPKGAAYLRGIESKTPEQLAIMQLKGLKLLAWAILLAVFQTLWFRFFHGYLRIPMPDQALAMSVGGTPVAWHLRWESQILAYFELILSFSIFGHRLIACCRMAGFNALRNTYRPLSATSLIEFFNRFYYYFKELLVEFFYYPAFLRYWKRHRRLRTVFATFAAVVFGNSFYHLTRDWHFLRDEGFWRGIASYQVLIVHNTALAVGLCVSQLRKRGPKPCGFIRGRLLPAVGVAFFYILLIVFACQDRTFTLAQTSKYFASLFFIHW
jgi:hypothetical protein